MPCSAPRNSTHADASVACPHSGTSRVGVNQRRRKHWHSWNVSLELRKKRNAVSDRLFSSAIDCISSASRPPSRSALTRQTAAGLPPNGMLVNASTCMAWHAVIAHKRPSAGSGLRSSKCGSRQRCCCTAHMHERHAGAKQPRAQYASSLAVCRLCKISSVVMQCLVRVPDSSERDLRRFDRSWQRSLELLDCHARLQCCAACAHLIHWQSLARLHGALTLILSHC